jgi:hypothetical protein
MGNFDSIRRGIAPKASADEIRDLLWCCSPYPFLRDLRKLRRSIRKELRLGGGTIAGAINHAHEELDRAMSEYRQRNPHD